MNFEELKLKTTEISERIAYLAKFLKIADHRKQVKDLEEVMARPDFWDDKEKAQETVQKLSSEKNIVEPFAALEKHGEDFAAIAEFAVEDESFLAEADTALVELEKEIDKMELLSFLSGKFDRMNCFFFIHAGAGGTESCAVTICSKRRINFGNGELYFLNSRIFCKESLPSEKLLLKRE